MSESIALKDGEYRMLVKMIYDKCGIALGDNKQELVKTRLNKRLKALGLNSYSEYVGVLSSSRNDDEMMLMINAISTNFTSFYREGRHFDFLLRQALPELMERKRKEKVSRFRAWCAASSTGEEPYTLALTLKEFFKDFPVMDVKLLATDISTKVLEAAVKGVYGEEKVKDVPSLLLNKYFDKVRAGGDVYFEARQELKDLITFRRLNLMDAVYPFKGHFDFIFCRNVMIYFDAPTQASVVEKLIKYLVPGGYLFTGHSENLPVALRSRMNVLAPATYRKME